MKKISLKELARNSGKENYGKLYEWILDQIKQGLLKPVKASGTNGKKPALFLEYWVVEKDEEKGQDKEELETELKYKLAPEIAIDYYLEHLDRYREDRDKVWQLSCFLKEKKKNLATKISWNERSFEIWQREKFLTKEQGLKILKRCGMTVEDLGVYQTAEPFSYFAAVRDTPQKVLIVENKDTFYSMRRKLLEEEQNALCLEESPEIMQTTEEEQAEQNIQLVLETKRSRQAGRSVLGLSIGTLIYGAGKGIWRAFEDFDSSAEPYMKAEGNRFFYFGDLDYEGILIYEKLAEDCKEKPIIPFCEAYLKMLEKAEYYGIDSLPETKKGQNRNIGERFFSFFSEEAKQRMKDILEQNKYIPQEILNYTDYGYHMGSESL